MRREYGRHVSFTDCVPAATECSMRVFRTHGEEEKLLPMFAPSFRDNPLVLLVVRVNLAYTSVLKRSFVLSVFDLKPLYLLFQEFRVQFYRNHWPNAVRLPNSVGFWWVRHLPTCIPQAVWVVTSGIESCHSNDQRDLCSRFCSSITNCTSDTLSTFVFV